MVELRASKPSEVPELQALYQLCFGDGPDYTSQYFDYFYRPEEFLVLRDEGELRAMGGLLSVTLTDPEGPTVKGAYLYALGTHPKFQKHGYAGTLLRYADFYLHGKRDCLLTVPARPDLHPFFQAAGFDECFPLLEGEVTPRAPRPGERAREVGWAEYDALRESLLASRRHVSYGALTGLQERLCKFCASALLALDIDGQAGCAVVERGNNIVLIKELLCPAGAEEGALALAAAGTDQVRCILRRPVESTLMTGLTKRTFGMIKWYDPLAARRWACDDTPYLGLAFD